MLAREHMEVGDRILIREELSFLRTIKRMEDSLREPNFAGCENLARLLDKTNDGEDVTLGMLKTLKVEKLRIYNWAVDLGKKTNTWDEYPIMVENLFETVVRLCGY